MRSGLNSFHRRVSVSLKSNLGLQDVEALVADVRRRVEYDDDDDTHRIKWGLILRFTCIFVSRKLTRSSFLSTLLPAGEADQEFVLLQGGLASHHAHVDRTLRSLLNETRSFISSADFGVVLGLCLDRGTETLIGGLRDNVYEHQYTHTPIRIGEGRGGEEGEEEDGEGAGAKVRLAALLPAVARWSHLAVNGMPNELVEVREGGIVFGRSYLRSLPWTRYDWVLTLMKTELDSLLVIQGLCEMREMTAFSAILYSSFAGRVA